MIDAYEGWAIRGCNGYLWGFIGRTRSEAIMNFMISVDSGIYKEAEAQAKSGRVFPSLVTTKAARVAWAKWRRKGFMAVRVLMEVCDCRVNSE